MKKAYGRGLRKIARRPRTAARVVAALAARAITAVNASDIAFADRLFDYALEDVKATRVLHAQGLYAAAVFHAHQAIEKTSKGFYVLAGFLNPARLRDAGHEPYRLPSKLNEDPTIWKFSTDLATLAETSAPKTGPEIRQLFKENEEQLARISMEAAERMMSVADMVEAKLEAESFPHVARMIHADKFPQGLAAFLRLFIMGAIYYPHYLAARYPDSGFNLADYTAELPAVALCPRVVAHVESSIKLFRPFTEPVRRPA